MVACELPRAGLRGTWAAGAYISRLATQVVRASAGRGSRRGSDLLSDFFETGAASGKGVLELIGPDVATFSDGLIGDSPTYADLYQESIRKKS